MSVARFYCYQKGTNFPTRLNNLLHGKVRFFASTSKHSQKPKETSSNYAISNVKDTSLGQLTIGEKVKQTTKDASYLGIIIAGVGITGMMFYAIFRELFSSESPNSIYSSTLERVRSDEKISLALGTPIKGYGELSSRGRRRHVSHLEFIKNGVSHMRMKFYVEGTRTKGTVHLEMKKDDNGKYNYEYLFLELDNGRIITLEDNRK